MNAYTRRPLNFFKKAATCTEQREVVDRRDDKPDILWKSDGLYIIDHEMRILLNI